jgi:hypothetical protein
MAAENLKQTYMLTLFLRTSDIFILIADQCKSNMEYIGSYIPIESRIPACFRWEG